MGNTERIVEASEGIIHDLKKKKTNKKNALLQSKQEQRWKHKIHWVVLKTQSHNHKGDDEVRGGGDKRPCKRF